MAEILREALPQHGEEIKQTPKKLSTDLHKYPVAYMSPTPHTQTHIHVHTEKHVHMHTQRHRDTHIHTHQFYT